MTVVVPEVIILIFWKVMECFTFVCCIVGIIGTSMDFPVKNKKRIAVGGWIIASLGWAIIFFRF